MVDKYRSQYFSFIELLCWKRLTEHKGHDTTCDQKGSGQTTIPCNAIISDVRWENCAFDETLKERIINVRESDNAECTR